MLHLLLFFIITVLQRYIYSIYYTVRINTNLQRMVSNQPHLCSKHSMHIRFIDHECQTEPCNRKRVNVKWAETVGN